MKKQLFLIVCLILIGMQSNAQVTTTPNTSGNYTTDYVGWDTGIPVPLRIKHEGNYGLEFYTNTGSGTFGTPKMMLNAAGYLGLGTGTTTPSSWLHIITSGSTLHEEPFRTAVAAGTETNWRMFKGTNQVMRLWNPSGGNELFFQTPQGGLKIGTGTGGTVTPAMIVLGGSGADAGNVGIGNYSSISPVAKLHVYNTTSSVDFQATNSVTGHTATDGFRMVNDNSGRVTMYNWEDDDIAFGTGNAGGI